MLKLFFLLASVLASVAYGQRIEDCQAAYDGCFDSANSHYQATGESQGLSYCNSQYKTCYLDAFKAITEKTGHRPNSFPALVLKGMKPYRPKASSESEELGSKPSAAVAKEIKDCQTEYNTCFEKANEIYEDSEDASEVFKCNRQVDTCFKKAYKGYVFPRGSSPASPAHHPLEPIMRRRPVKQPGEVVSDELEGEYKKCDKQWRKCSRLSKFDVKEQKQCDSSYNKCLLSAKSNADKEASRDVPQANTGSGSSNNGASASEEVQKCLDAHNKLRALHGVSPLRAPSAELQAYANKRGNELASTDVFAHPAKSSFGENLFMGYSSAKEFTCEDAVKAWYDEIKDYDFANPGFKSGTGHFTQVVWKDSEEVACSINKSPKTLYNYIVCNYSPPGNYMGRFEENVLPKN